MEVASTRRMRNTGSGSESPVVRKAVVEVPKIREPKTAVRWENNLFLHQNKGVVSVTFDTTP